MDDEMLELTTRSDAEVVRRLEAFADLRLSPSLAARTRIRAAVMDAARERAATIAAADANDVAVLAVASTTPVSRPAWRRPMAAFAAATLTLGLLAGSALASSPGGPLYAARLWAEMANLPQAGNARAQAEAQRLGQRLAEVQQASATGNEAATEAALTAYASILAEATSGSAGDPEAQKTLEVAVTRHVAVLSALADRVPAPAQAAIQRALVSSTAALDGLHGAGGGSGTPAGNGGGSGGGTGANPGGDQGTPGANGDPVKSAQPGGGKPSARPDKPAPTTKPAKTNHPNPTPRNGPNGPPATGGPNNPPHKGPAQ